jgi:sporulation protein YlmC with PRC-barrel domain
MSTGFGGCPEQPLSKSFHKEEVEGKTVVDSLGAVRGKVKDLVFSLDGNVALIIESVDGSEARVPLSRVTGISDYVVVRTEVAPEPGTAPVASGVPGASYPSFANPTEASSACKFCGTIIPAGSTYCPGCGRSRV